MSKFLMEGGVTGFADNNWRVNPIKKKRFLLLVRLIGSTENQDNTDFR